MKHSFERGFIVPVVIALIAMFAIGAYAYENHKKTAAVPMEKSSMAEQKVSPNINADKITTSSSEGTFASLMTLSEPQKCDVSFNAGTGASIEGSVYISKGNMRGDYSAGVSGQTFKVHFIVDGKDSYTWMDGIAMGFKSAMSQGTVDTSVQTKSSSQAFNVNQKVKYSCAPWATDSSLFALPNGVTFTATPKMGGSVKAGSGY